MQKLETEIQTIRQERPFEIQEWADAVGLASTATNSLITHLAERATEVADLDKMERKLWAYNEKARARQYAVGESAEAMFKRATEYLARGRTTAFGKLLETSPLKHSGYLLAIVANQARRNV